MDAEHGRSLVLALAIQALAFLVCAYRLRFVRSVSPDGRYYIQMTEGRQVPAPFSRRWLLPFVVRYTRIPWGVLSTVAFLACGPLMYGATGSLAMVWLGAWLPGWTLSIRLPVLADMTAYALMLGAIVLCKEGHEVAACVVLFLAAQAKEPSGLFGAVVCWANPWVAATGLLSTGVAVLVGNARGGEATEEYMRHPFRDALGRHDPLDWRAMLLPWGAIPLLWAATWAGMGELEAVACVSLVLAYGQLALARDESRLFLWAAPAVLMAMATADMPWLALGLLVHPFMCAMTKRV